MVELSINVSSHPDEEPVPPRRSNSSNEEVNVNINANVIANANVNIERRASDVVCTSEALLKTDVRVFLSTLYS